MSRDFITDHPLPEDIVVKKEAKRLGEDVDFGEVQKISREYIITQIGSANNERYYIPKNLLERFDKITRYFKITKEEAEQYKKTTNY